MELIISDREYDFHFLDDGNSFEYLWWGDEGDEDDLDERDNFKHGSTFSEPQDGHVETVTVADVGYDGDEITWLVSVIWSEALSLLGSDDELVE